jgi:hypothetical protein
MSDGVIGEVFAFRLKSRKRRRGLNYRIQQ